ncbi:hypothetical protein HMPREF1602_05075 [Escherichia coli 907889]|nr:hypothetical protein HMPREF1602_05075 [Escherichia coli 907889]
MFLRRLLPGFYRKLFGFSDLYDGEEGIQHQIVSASSSAFTACVRRLLYMPIAHP